MPATLLLNNQGRYIYGLYSRKIEFIKLKSLQTMVSMAKGAGLSWQKAISSSNRVNDKMEKNNLEKSSKLCNNSGDNNSNVSSGKGKDIKMKYTSQYRQKIVKFCLKKCILYSVSTVLS
jgi:hypothetical protein